MFYEVKAIARAKIKTDKRDSEVLAHLLRMNMIPEVYRRSTENRQVQRVLRQRAFYVSAMTALKNRVHAFLAQQGEEVRETNIFSEKGQKVLLRLDLAPRAFDVSRAAGRGASVCACWAGGPSRRVRCWSDWPWSFRGGTRHR
jgi:transposase